MERIEFDENGRFCRRCDICKPWSEFYSVRFSEKGYRQLPQQCKQCLSEKRLERMKIPEIAEKTRIREENYRKNNPEKVKESSRKFRAKPDYKEKIAAKRALKTPEQKRKESERRRQRREENPHIRIVHNSRVRLGRLLKGGRKSGKTLDLLGCSNEFLVSYISEKWSSGMNWGNHSQEGWHLDHIIPCNLFDLELEENQKICFHYSNLQPMWAEENIRKHDKFDLNLFFYFQLTSYDFFLASVLYKVMF